MITDMVQYNPSQRVGVLIMNNILLSLSNTHRDIHCCMEAAIIHLELIANLLPINSVCVIKP